MKVSIYSREAIVKLIKNNFPDNVAVISFYDPKSKYSVYDTPVDYSSVTDRVFYVCIPDLDITALEDVGLTFDTYFTQADNLAEFIYNAKNEGLDIICQCDYGESRSAGCAAAILEHFYKTGISVFADYRYYPNQVVFNKMLEELEKHKNNS